MKTHLLLSILLLWNISISQAEAQKVGITKENSEYLLLAMNHYSFDELRAISGITSRRAKSILSYRDYHHTITQIEDLKGLPGFEGNAMTILANQFDQNNKKLKYALIHPKKK